MQASKRKWDSLDVLSERLNYLAQVGSRANQRRADRAFMGLIIGYRQIRERGNRERSKGKSF